MTSETVKITFANGRQEARFHRVARLGMVANAHDATHLAVKRRRVMSTHAAIHGPPLCIPDQHTPPHSNYDG
jgi:hypothetical protein